MDVSRAGDALGWWRPILVDVTLRRCFIEDQFVVTSV
jgi:hypothetical protein